MTFEELLVKLGFSGEGLQRGLTEAKANVADFGERTREHMNKAATSARAVHGVIGEITKISPEAGLAITGAFSAPMAALELLKLGIEALKDYWEDAKKQALEAKVAFEKSLEEPAEKARALRKALFEREREGPVSEKEKKRLEEIVEAEFAAKNTEKLDKAKKEANEAAPGFFKMAWKMASEGALGAVKDLTEEQGKLLGKVVDENKALDDKKDKLIDLQEQQTKALDDKKKNEELDKLDEQRLRNRAALVEKMHREEKAARDADERFQHYLDQAARSYLPTQAETLKAPGAYGNLARQIQAARGQISQGILSGNLAAIQGGTEALFGRTDYLNQAEVGGEQHTVHMNDRLDDWNRRNKEIQEQFMHRGLTPVHRPGLEDKMKSLQDAALELIKSGLTGEGIVVRGKDGS